MFLTFVTAANAESREPVVLASIDANEVAVSGLKVERKNDMPDFTITYLLGPEFGDSIGIYEGGYPSTFSGKGRRLGEIRADIADQKVIWTCWSEEREGKKMFGSELLMPSKRIAIGEKDFSVQFHVFVIRHDLKSLAEGRRLAARLIKKGPNKSPEPTPTAVTPRATETKTK